MKNVAYLRVSTTNQDLDQQRLAILDYAQKHKIVVVAEGVALETHGETEKVSPVCSTACNRTAMNLFLSPVLRAKNSSKEPFLNYSLILSHKTCSWLVNCPV